VVNLRLRKLEIQGFKSFPDKTTLAFESPITAVVGPNGSGKSNIADAVRWVLGEQSTKTLRGGKMEDVIFAGTQSRGAVGYAHVQLVIDGVQGDTADTTGEVTISRRLYRSGESEYRINGAAVRLKDIHELLMDTGLGRDGYSIIGQGRIAEIVSAKSGSRREIFEEAAGISKFRYRKEEAQRKLAQAEDNLVRLRDILLELESRVGPLAEQNEKAKAFLEYSGEKKTLEISLWMESLSGFKALLSAQEDKIYLCKNSYQALENESAENERETGALYSRMQSLGAQVEETRGAVKAIEEQMTGALSLSAVLQNDIRHNEQSIEQLTTDLANLKLGSGELAVQLAEKESEIAAGRDECTGLEGKVEAASQRLEEQRESAAKAAAELEELSIRRESAAQAIQHAMLEKASSQTMLEESAARLEDLRAHTGSYDAALKELEESLEECALSVAEEEEKLTGLRNSKSGYSLKKEGRKKALEDVEQQAVAYIEKARDARRRAGLLEDLEKSMEGFAGSVKYILSQAGRGALSGIIGPVSSLISVENEYTLAIETALGAAMQNIVVEDEVCAKRAIRTLQESRSGRATFLPLDTIKGETARNLDPARRQEGFIGLASELVQINSRYAKVADQLLGRVLVAEDLNTAGKIAKAMGYSLRVVSLDGQVINAGGSFTGGSSSKGAGVLGRRREIERLQEQAKQLEAQAAQLEPSRKSIAEELSAVDAALAGLDGDIQTAQEEIIRLAATQTQLAKNIENAAANRDLAKKEQESLVARLEGLKDQELGAATMLEEMDARLAELEAGTAGAQNRRDSLNVGVSAAQEALAELRMSHLTAQKDLERLEQELEQLTLTRQGEGERAEQLEEKKVRLTTENAEILARIAQVDQENKTRLEEKEAMSAKITELGAARNELEAKITTLHTADKELSSKREVVSREMAELEAGKASIQGEHDQIISKLWDEYELTRSEAAEVAVTLESKSEAQRRLSELRGKIRALGSVNLGAIEEYAEVSERYKFMSEQVGDVEESKRKLLELIGGLTQDMREIFTENFEKIARHFSKIFVQLFGGGRAELTLTDSEDVLEAGVEIFVQPPGKIIKNLSLLSGGEQAYVAIAIYFAILRVRPSPFCVLDEIEAPLDDVNVVKFATYLRRMSTNTQFIAITHRRGTMEEADTLYGVTMQEKGTSKLLKLEASEVEDKLGMSG